MNEYFVSYLRKKYKVLFLYLFMFFFLLFYIFYIKNPNIITDSKENIDYLRINQLKYYKMLMKIDLIQAYYIKQPPFNLNEKKNYIYKPIYIFILNKYLIILYT